MATCQDSLFGCGSTSSQQDAKRVNDKLERDAGYAQSEYERTLSVIKNRQRAGLDTRLQEKYLDRVKGSIKSHVYKSQTTAERTIFTDISSVGVGKVPAIGNPTKEIPADTILAGGLILGLLILLKR